MTLGERIKKVRKALDLTQQAFAGQIGTSANVLTNYETGRRNPSAAALNNICKTFNISEEWIRNGIEPMFVPSPEESVDELIQEHGLDDLDRQIIMEFIKLKPEDREAVKKYVRNLAEHIEKEKTPQTLTAEQEARAEADRYYEQLLLEKKQASQASSANESDVG